MAFVVFVRPVKWYLNGDAGGTRTGKGDFNFMRHLGHHASNGNA